MPRQRLQWVCPFGGERHPGGRQHIVHSRLAFRRHLTLVHNYDLIRRTAAEGGPRDEIVPLVGESLERRVAAYRRSQRHRGPTGPPGASMSTDDVFGVLVAPPAAPAGGVAAAAQPTGSVTTVQPAGYRSPLDSTDEDQQTVGTADSASDIFADLSPRAQARLDDLTVWFETSGEAGAQGAPGGSLPVVGGSQPRETPEEVIPSVGGPWSRASPRASGGDRPSTADAEAQADLRAGGWRPNFSLTRAAQLIAGRMRLDTTAPPARIGREVARLMGLSAQDFVSHDLIEAIATGIAQHERDAAMLLISQLQGIAAVDGTGAWGLYFVAREFSRWLQRPFDDWEGGSNDRAALQ